MAPHRMALNDFCIMKFVKSVYCWNHGRDTFCEYALHLLYRTILVALFRSLCKFCISKIALINQHAGFLSIKAELFSSSDLPSYLCRHNYYGMKSRHIGSEPVDFCPGSKQFDLIKIAEKTLHDES